MGELVLTFTGRDAPGITARLSAALAEAGAALVDVEQVSVQGLVTLAFLVRIDDEALAGLRTVAHELGLSFEHRAGAAPSSPGAHYAITLMGRELGLRELHAVSAICAGRGANIERMTRLGEAAFELTVAYDGEEAAFKRELLAAARGFDCALQRESLLRRSKRLIVLDMDSTLIQIEVIDELARAHGVGARVAEITARAMAGELDYDQSLRERVALLRGLDAEVLYRLAANLPLTEGAETLLRVLKSIGFRTAIISGGFSVAAEALRQRLSVDDAFSNTLEIEGGVLTGRVSGAIVNAARKAELLESLAARERIPLDQTVAVGDGANDLLMLQKAGLGIAFRAKPRLREAAHSAIDAMGLDAILYLLGLTARDIAQAAGRA